MLAVHAVIPRYGLGNCLFPWARAEIFARRHALPMLRPVWFKPKLGPYLRREPDKRNYWRLFGGSDYVTGGAWLRQRWLATQHAEPVDWFRGESVRLPESGTMIFSGLKPPGWGGDYFAPLHGQAAFLRERLLRACRPAILARMGTRPRAPYIAVHLRRGDLAISLKSADTPAYVPEGWYGWAIDRIRAEPGWAEIPVQLMTDAAGPEIDDLLARPGVKLVDQGDAISNIFHLSRAAVLIGTAYSTFSRWAAFLGDMPVVYCARYVSEPVRLNQPGGCYEGELPEKGLLPSVLGRDLMFALTKHSAT